MQDELFQNSLILWVSLITTYVCLSKTFVRRRKRRRSRSWLRLVYGNTIYLLENQLDWALDTIYGFFTSQDRIDMFNDLLESGIRCATTALATVYDHVVRPTYHRWYRQRELTSRTHSKVLPQVLCELIWEYAEPGPMLWRRGTFEFTPLNIPNSLFVSNEYRMDHRGRLYSMATQRPLKVSQLLPSEVLGLGAGFVLFHNTDGVHVWHLDEGSRTRCMKTLTSKPFSSLSFVAPDTVLLLSQDRRPTIFVFHQRNPAWWKRYDLFSMGHKLNGSGCTNGFIHNKLSDTIQWGCTSLQLQTKQLRISVTDDTTGRESFVRLPLRSNDVLEKAELFHEGVLYMEFTKHSTLVPNYVSYCKQWYQLEHA